MSAGPGKTWNEKVSSFCMLFCCMCHKEHSPLGMTSLFYIPIISFACFGFNQCWVVLTFSWELWISVIVSAIWESHWFLVSFNNKGSRRTDSSKTLLSVLHVLVWTSVGLFSLLILNCRFQLLWVLYENRIGS